MGYISQDIISHWIRNAYFGISFSWDMISLDIIFNQYGIFKVADSNRYIVLFL